MSVRVPFALLPVLFLSLVLSVTPTHATRVLPLNLEELTKHAALIVSGRCTEVREERDTELGNQVTVITVDVERTLKGAASRRVTFRQIAGVEEGQGGASGVAGMPVFRKDEEVVL